MFYVLTFQHLKSCLVYAFSSNKIMPVTKGSVLLLKSQKSEGESDKYEDTLKKRGYASYHVKTLDFKYQNLEVLARKLSNADEFSGIILSSPRCVNAVSQALNGKTISDKWKSKQNFVVGETTGEVALKLLDLTCQGSETGNANNLATKIINDHIDELKYDKPFLFPHGNLKTDTLRTHFSKVGIGLGEVLVYETIPNPNLRKELADTTADFTQIPEYVVFFSPSGVQSSISLIRAIDADLSLVKFIAIGPVTEQKMKEENIPVASVATRPTPEDVLQAILATNTT